MSMWLARLLKTLLKAQLLMEHDKHFRHTALLQRAMYNLSS